MVSQLSWEESMGSIVTNNEMLVDTDNHISKDKKSVSKSVKKFRKPVTIEAMLRATFDSSSYDKSRKAKPLDLNPIVINKISKVNVFGSSYLGQRSYKSSTL